MNAVSTMWTKADFVPSRDAQDQDFHIGEICFIFQPKGTNSKFFASRVDIARSGSMIYLVVETTPEAVKALFGGVVTIRDFFLRQKSQVLIVANSRSALTIVTMRPTDVPSSYFSEHDDYWTLVKGETLLSAYLN